MGDRKDIGIQVSSEDSVPPVISSQIPLPEIEFPQFFYKPHRISLLILVSAVICYISLLRDDQDPGSNQRFGLVCVLAICTFVLGQQLANNGIMSRPHPSAWRYLQGAGICYAGMLVFLSVQNTEDSRKILGWIDPALGTPLPEDDYAVDCRVFTPENPESLFYNLRKNMFDFYILCHLFGWWLKMLILRDVKLCWCLSIFFEFLEISLRHQLPNFWECWWDSLILDILFANALGIYLGYLTCSLCKMKQYHWGIGMDQRDESGHFSSISKHAVQLMPYSWVTYKWSMLKDTKNFLSIIYYIFFLNMVDLSNFYLKFVLWVPSNHWFLLARVWFWAIIAIVSTREYYEFIMNDKKTLGWNCWLSHMILLLEWCIIFKNSIGTFADPMPFWLQIAWSCIATGVLTTGLILFYRDIQKKVVS